MRRLIALTFALTLLVLPVRAVSASRYVALTFDDGPSGKYTRALLDGLYDRGAKATFLLCGYRIKDYPEIAQRILEEHRGKLWVRSEGGYNTFFVQLPLR